MHRHTTQREIELSKGMKHFSLICAFFLFVQFAQAQELNSLYRQLKFVPSTHVFSLDSISINPSYFKVFDAQGKRVSDSLYTVDFSKAQFKFLGTYNDSITVYFLKYPEFLTQTYQIYDPSRVVTNEAGKAVFQSTPEKNRFAWSKPFDGLQTAGSITRGVTVGNNQNSVLQSNLDLQISGRISERVGIRASIQDTNIPIQQGGYSQRLDEFDQVYVELFSENWAVRAGDLFLNNTTSRLMNFNKKVQGLSYKHQFGTESSKTTVEASGALVRGQYARSNFTGIEGNQGPYKLRGPNGELFVLVISGSERVFVNGVLLQRGENNQYVIDYNAGEITFTSLFPITSEMRIVIEYQYLEQNYTRFITYNSIKHEREKWHVGAYFYNETDSKNQPLQQNLSDAQIEILQQAGNNPDLMFAPSAVPEAFSENRILYRKILVGGVEVFEFSNNPNDELFQVRFSFVGAFQGNYIVVNNQAVGRIYAYVPPENGVPQGDFEPIVRLVAPKKLQVFTLVGAVEPNEKTQINYEFGMSYNDQNLFSSIDNENNRGFAGLVNIKQRLLKSNHHQVSITADWQWVEERFRTIERLFNIEFNRDWNLVNPFGNQNMLQTGLIWQWNTVGEAAYAFENLNFSGNFSGTRHKFRSTLNKNNWLWRQNGSLTTTQGLISEGFFNRNTSHVVKGFAKNWVHLSNQWEHVSEKNVQTGVKSALSQRFNEWGAQIGRGDSTKVFAAIGMLYRENDSLQQGVVQRVNTSLSYFLNTRLIQNERTQLAVFLNYRNLKFTDARPNEKSLHSRISYNDTYLNSFIQSQWLYETSSGTLAQQEFTYVEVEPGQGVYMWNDYNANGIQEIEEFEVAPFPDLARYIRVFLPNQIFVQTHVQRLSKTLTLNPSVWQQKNNFWKWMSRFYNQTNFLLEKRVRRQAGTFEWNPFEGDENDILGLNQNFRNTLFLHRGKQRYSLTHTYVYNKMRSLLSVGSQETTNRTHQLQFTHLIKKSWLFITNTTYGESALDSENFALRNFDILQYSFFPKLSYLLNTNKSLAVFIEHQNKENQLGSLETLAQWRYGFSFNLAGVKNWTLNGEWAHVSNSFRGENFTPVAFQMLEGLQPGKNQTWRLMVQKSLTQFLDINLSYQGRKSTETDAIHTGNVQLRAFF